jgi:cytochrome c biogenesis protein CcdA
MGSASELPGLGILPRNSPDLSGSLYVYMTEDNVTAWSSERNGGEFVENNAAFRGNAIKDEQFTLAKDETFEIMGEWQFPEDPVIPIKPGDITAVAVVYDLDDTSSGRSDGGNPATIPRAIQSATPRSTAIDMGSDLPTVGEVDISYDSDAQITAKFDDEDGISSAYLLYTTEATNSSNWEYVEMEISGEELCDDSGACYAYTDSEGLAIVPMKEGETLYYQFLVYDGNFIEGKTPLLIYDAQAGVAASQGGDIPLALIAMSIGIIVLIFSIVYMFKEKIIGPKTNAIDEPDIINERVVKKASKSVMLVGIILGIMLISMGAVAMVLPSGDSKVADFEMIDVDGNEFSLSDHRGKVVYLEFMATWCSDCQKLTKELKDVYSHFGNDIVMISLDIDKKENPEQLKKYADDNGAKWIFAFPKDFNKVVETFNIHEIPKSFVIDKNGDLTHEFLLSQPSNEIIDKITTTKSGMASTISLNSIPIEILAFAAGIALFMSPCAFPMLPGYVGYYLGMDDQPQQASKKEVLKKALPTGIAAALGILSVFIFIGILVMIIGSPITPFIPLLAPFVAIFIIILGIMMLSNIQYYSITNKLNAFFGKVISKIKFGNMSLSDKVNEKEVGGTFTYGMGYGLAAAGCTLPVFLVIITGALTKGGFFSGLFVFIIFGLGMALFMFVVTILVATSKDSIINKMKMSTGKIKMVSGVFMLVAGVALLAGFYLTFMV